MIVVVVIIGVTATGGTVTAGGLGVVVTVVDVTGGAAVGGTVAAEDGFVVVVAADSAGAVLIAGVVFVTPVAGVPVFVVTANAAAAVALCIASGIWTTVSGVFPVTGSKETMSALWVMLANWVKSRCTVQLFPAAAGKVTFC